MTTEAEMLVMLLQAKEYLEPPEVRTEARNGTSPKALRRNKSCEHLDFKLLVFRTVRE